MGWVSVVCHKTFLHLLVPHFPPLIVPTSHFGGETGSLQTVFDVSVFSVPGRDTVASGSSIVVGVGKALKDTVGAASQIVPF